MSDKKEAFLMHLAGSIDHTIENLEVTLDDLRNYGNEVRKDEDVKRHYKATILFMVLTRIFKEEVQLTLDDIQDATKKH